MEFVEYMQQAIAQARVSLREGNNGFGAVVVREGKIIARAHDQEDTTGDPTAHAEIIAIRRACRKVGKNLADCLLVSTHEPCPMCATAVIWAGLTEIAYGYSIKQALDQGRRRIGLTCRELFATAEAAIKIHPQVLPEECSMLYRRDVRAEIEKLRGADAEVLRALNEDSVRRRLEWFREKREQFRFSGCDALESGYRLLLARFNITPEQAPVQEKTDDRLVFHSRNFCPTLEACKILKLDTRTVCRQLNENATDLLLRQIDPRLKFTRNYGNIRPYAEYCEEMISFS
jgi:tRNA(adenine34) deaminase